MSKRVTDRLLAALFPPRCALCDGLLTPEELRAGSGIHTACKKFLVAVEEPTCMHCGRPLDREEQEYCHDCGRLFNRSESFCRNERPPSYITQGKAVFVYQGQIKGAMYRFKYANRREYADFLADAACERYGAWMRRCEVETVVPVPMYRAKERRRGYNQAALFARELARRMELACEPRLVIRTRDTRPQKELNDLERKNNLKNAFQTRDVVVKYKRVLLVDDIYTTGSTAEAVAEELCRAGAEHVFFLSACTGKGL